MVAKRIRATIRKTGDRSGELRTALEFRQRLYTSSPIEIELNNPLVGTHRDETGSAYFEFTTEYAERVPDVVRNYGFDGKVDIDELPPLPGEECVNCGNVAGPLRPTICPNCNFRDISPCPVCATEVSRESYRQVVGSFFTCPHCRSRVRLRYNSPMFLEDGSYVQPLVIVEEAALTHEIR